jgi:Mrp family chromosome partitioning ATPase
MPTEKDVIGALSKVMDPELNRSLVDLGMVRNIRVKDGRVSLDLALTTLACPLKDRISQEAREAVLALEDVERVEVNLTEMSSQEKERITSESGEHLSEHLNNIKHVIAVMSGKGGVGKSLVAGMLATALVRGGHRVGILDADITGPSIPKMFFEGTPRPQMTPLGIAPVSSRLGIKIISINLLLPNERDAVIWRGPLIAGTIKQFWGDVFWADLDYLVVDLPPGTSDASLTVMQSIPLEGVILVTSPQDLAAMVVGKAQQMAEKMNVPILGLMENMSYFVAPDTGKRYDLFGPSRAEERAREMGVPFLGQLPIDPRIAELSDRGRIEDYESEVFVKMARTLAGDPEE